MNNRSRRLPDKNPSKPEKAAAELDATTDLGMKREALRHARRILKQPTIHFAEFNAALNAILTLASRCGPWTQLVEGAYERTPARQRTAVRIQMMGFRISIRDHEGVLRLQPKRFTGELWILELAYCLDAALALNRMEVARNLGGRMHRALNEAANPTMQEHLLEILVEVTMRNGHWEDAKMLAEDLMESRTFNRNAVVAIVEIHAACALIALRKGIKQAGDYRNEIDPELELKIPGTASALQDDAIREFQQNLKLVEKLLPKERQRELGLDSA